MTGASHVAPACYAVMLWQFCQPASPPGRHACLQPLHWQPAASPVEASLMKMCTHCPISKLRGLSTYDRQGGGTASGCPLSMCCAVPPCPGDLGSSGGLPAVLEGPSPSSVVRMQVQARAVIPRHASASSGSSPAGSCPLVPPPPSLWPAGWTECGCAAAPRCSTGNRSSHKSGATFV